MKYPVVPRATVAAGQVAVLDLRLWVLLPRNAFVMGSLADANVAGVLPC